MRGKLYFAGIVIVVSILYSLFSTKPVSPEASLQRATTSPEVAAAAVVAPAVVPTAQSRETDTYSVIKVVDGDTLAIDVDGTPTTLRLIGLDTPETVDPRKPVQCFGKAASDKAKELLTGKHVTIEYDPTQGSPSFAKASEGTVDKYGRTLAYVFLEDGTLFNRYMIAEGYGHEYTYDTPYKYQADFKAAEANARTNKLGLWSDDACAAESSRTPTSSSQTTPAPTSGQYDCSHNVYNCSSFKTQAEAQAVFDACGGSSNDIHKLDNDRDGNVCESLP